MKMYKMINYFSLQYGFHMLLRFASQSFHMFNNIIKKQFTLLVGDYITSLHIEGDGFASECLHEDLHATAEAQHQVLELWGTWKLR